MSGQVTLPHLKGPQKHIQKATTLVTWWCECRNKSIVSLADSTALFHGNVNEIFQSQQLVILVSNLQYKKLEIDITLLFITSIQKLIAERWTTLETKPKKTTFPPCWVHGRHLIFLNVAGNSSETVCHVNLNLSSVGFSTTRDFQMTLLIFAEWKGEHSQGGGRGLKRNIEGRKMESCERQCCTHRLILTNSKH